MLMLDKDKPYYSLNEVAEELGVSRETIRRLIKKRVLEAYKVGIQYRISRLGFERYLNRSKNAEGL